MPNAQCPMPNAPCPMPHAQCPIPNAQFNENYLSISDWSPKYRSRFR
ncbi:MAG: hypothetical protein V7K98_06615 [Nostoc sp.]